MNRQDPSFSHAVGAALVELLQSARLPKEEEASSCYHQEDNKVPRCFSREQMHHSSLLFQHINCSIHPLSLVNVRHVLRKLFWCVFQCSSRFWSICPAAESLGLPEDHQDDGPQCLNRLRCILRCPTLHSCFK